MIEFCHLIRSHTHMHRDGRRGKASYLHPLLLHLFFHSLSLFFCLSSFPLMFLSSPSANSLSGFGETNFNYLFIYLFLPGLRVNDHIDIVIVLLFPVLILKSQSSHIFWLFFTFCLCSFFTTLISD